MGVVRSVPVHQAIAAADVRDAVQVSRVAAQDALESGIQSGARSGRDAGALQSAGAERCEL